MDSITFRYKERTITARMEIVEKGGCLIDYIVYANKNAQIFYFRKQGGWVLAYGNMPDDLRDAIIAALKERFGED